MSFSSPVLAQRRIDEAILVRNCGTCYFEDANLLSGPCPQPTIGYSAFIFFSLIELIIKSQCDITDPCRRVRDVKSPKAKELQDTNYDFIIVGGGVSGVVVATRLSENSDHKVLLLEAGPEEPTISSVPAFAFRANHTNFDWQFQTIPQKRACLSNDGVCEWPRGKMLCGTACLSGLMYTRGHPSIYNNWAIENKGWSYDELLYYFKKSEANTEPADYIEKEYHGFDGPLSVSRFPYLPDLAPCILDGASELGYRIADVNGHNQEAFTIAPIMVKDGVLASPNKQYLRPVLHRKNLQVLINSLAIKVMFDETGTRATGVEFLDKWGNVKKFNAAKEVILTGGVVGSPQLLLLSGVGPKDELGKHNIKTVRNLPVGENLHYHVGFSITVRLQGENKDSMTPCSLYEYVTQHKGPFASTGLTQITGFVASKFASKGVPDLQIFLDGYSAKCRDESTLNETSDITFRPIYLISKCRGTIKLRSSNPHDKPLIDPNYLCDEEEINILIEAQEIVRNLTQTKAMKPKLVQWDVQANENCKRYKETNKREYWSCVIREYTNGENHHAGTCKMGPASDPYAVVDNELRVHGIPNLRVADASVFPSPINCNPIGPVVMIGEKVSDMIKQTWK